MSMQLLRKEGHLVDEVVALFALVQIALSDSSRSFLHADRNRVPAMINDFDQFFSCRLHQVFEGRLIGTKVQTVQTVDKRSNRPRL